MRDTTKKFLEKLGDRVQGDEVVLDVQGDGARVIRCHIDVIEEFWGDILANDSIDIYAAMLEKNEKCHHGWRSIIEVWHKAKII